MRGGAESAAGPRRATKGWRRISPRSVLGGRPSQNVVKVYTGAEFGGRPRGLWMDNTRAPARGVLRQTAISARERRFIGLDLMPRARGKYTTGLVHRKSRTPT